MTYEEYCKKKLEDAVALMEEARDAISSLSLAQCRLNNVRLDLADRMDQWGARRYNFDTQQEEQA